MLFALIGLVGLVVHILVLSVYLASFGPADFRPASLSRRSSPWASNFLLNNEITYRASATAGPAWSVGFLAFALACGVGALANINVASLLYNSNQTWWVSGIAGALLSVVWNYAVSSQPDLAPAPAQVRRFVTGGQENDDRRRPRCVRPDLLAAVPARAVESRSP